MAKNKGLSITALVLGICSIVLIWVPLLDWLLSILAIIFGAVSLVKVNKGEIEGKGMAVAGLILGIIAIVLLLFITLIFGLAIFTGRMATFQQQIA